MVVVFLRASHPGHGRRKGQMLLASTAKGSRSDITKDSTVRAHVYMNSVYFGNRQFGVSLTCEAVLVYKAADEAQGVSVFGDYMMVDE